MKRYSASSKQAQQWIKETSQDNLFLCSIYDELGRFRDSESIYESTVKIAKFIRISQVEETEIKDPSKLEPDVDIVNIDDVNKERYQHGDYAKLIDSGFSYANPIDNEINHQRQHVNEFVRALSMGGSDVKRSLQNLSIAVRRYAMYESLSKEILMALSHYYKNPYFIGTLGESGKRELLADDIIKGDVDQDTVSIVANFEEIKNALRSVYTRDYQNIVEILRKHKPELANNDLFIRYLISESIITEESIVKNLKFLSADAITKALSVQEKAKSLGYISASLNGLKRQKNFVEFFCKYPQKSVFDKVLRLISEDRELYPEALGGHGYSTLEYRVLNNRIGINEGRIQFYPGLVDYLCSRETPAIPRFNFIEPDKINALLITGNFEDIELNYEKSNRVLGEKYFSDKPEERSFFENNPITKDLNNPILWALGSKMNQIDPVKGLKAFYSIINYTSIQDYDFNIIPSLLPVYIQYFSNDNNLRSYSSSGNDIDKFNKFYIAYRDKIFDFNLDEIRVFGDHVDKDTFEYKRGVLNIDQYEVVKKHSGQYLSNFNIFKFYFSMPFGYQIPYETLYNFVQFVAEANNRKINHLSEYDKDEKSYKDAMKNLFLIGKYDPLVYDTVSGLTQFDFTEDNKEFLIKLIYEYKNPDGPKFIGNFNSMKYLNETSLRNPDASLTELFFTKEKLTENPNFINQIKDQMSKYRNYSNIIPGSDEYNKLFAVVSQNTSVIGRDPKLITTLADCALDANNRDNAKQNYHYISAAMGKNNFYSMDKYTEQALTRIIFRQQMGNYNLSHNFCKYAGIKPAHIINLGGFEVLFNMSEEEVREWLNSIRFRDPDTFIREWQKYLIKPDALSTLELKIDKNILYNKILFLFYKTFFDKIRQSNPNILENLGTGSEFAQLMRTQEYSNHYQGYIEYLEAKVLCGVDCEPELMRIYKLDVKLPRELTLPKHVTEDAKTTFSNFERLSNIGCIVQVLGNLSMELLDAYSFEACRKNGYPTKGFLAIPDIALKGEIIHDFANLLPSNLNQKFGGYAQYFKNNFKNDKKGLLKYVGDAWSRRIKIWDDKDNVLEEGFVYEFSTKYPIDELAKIVKFDSFRQIMKDLPVKDRNFAFEYADNKGLPKESDSTSQSYKELFAGTQDVFLNGLKVPLPDWASFTDSSNDLTLRFLKRNDPQGMFLGIKTRCCQQPEDWAASCAYDGHLSPNAAFAVFEAPEGLIFQSYVWQDSEGDVCFDSIESPDKFSNYDKYGEDAKELMMRFAKSLPKGTICNVGQNNFDFPYTEDRLLNLTKTHEIDYVRDLLIKFSPNRGTQYTGDSLRQYSVGVGMREPDQQNNM